MAETADFIVIGAGIAGASAAYELASDSRVIVLERESQPGYHTTGRSAALFTETYGNRAIRAITGASRAFFETPPRGFSEHPLLTPRGTLLIGRADQEASLALALAEGQRTLDAVSMIGGDELAAKVPFLKPGYAKAAVWEPDARDMDVHAIHQGFLKGLRARGGKVVTDAEVMGLAVDGDWWVETRAGIFKAPVVINAAGAWADVVAHMAGAKAVGLVPKRRTAFTFDVPAGVAVEKVPAVIDVDETWYIKPEAGRLLGSPADETPSEPCDAQPEELDLAIAVDRIEQALAFGVGRLHSKWAGLRSFVADKSMVAGFAKKTPGFFWLAGQGGYGIQTSPGMARIAADLARGRSLPQDIADRGLDAADLSPNRLSLEV
ncbi:MAG: FAD-binding oxidoreductase [Alphaproteobacteria bacterium]|nr:FAD-binding oxidoreductase [Alphaproteobacteria bacterium]